MTLRRVALLAGLVLLGPITDALAQAPTAEPPCFSEFTPLRNEAEKRAASFKSALERKLPPDELCGLIRRFSEAEAKVVKYADENQSWCGIPPQAITAMKGNHGKTVEFEKKVCAPGFGGGGDRPHGSGLGEALGTRTFAPDFTGNGSGTFDTLTGTPLKR